MSGDGLRISIGNVDIALRSSIPGVARGIELLYADYPLSQADCLIDFEIELSPPGSLRRWLRPQVVFSFEGHTPFKPLPQNQAFAMFEWGLNWVIANHLHQYAIIHAAAIEKNGRGVILPGAPGSGKSTLCAAMVCRGWRLLSDEMALISLHDGQLWPFPRPVSLKNASIDIIREFSAAAVMGDAVKDTTKGTVAHMRAPCASVDASRTPVPPSAIVFPSYQADASTSFVPVGKGRALMQVTENCFNFPVLGPAGFSILADVVERSRIYALRYSHLEEAIAAMEQ